MHQAKTTSKEGMQTFSMHFGTKQGPVLEGSIKHAFSEEKHWYSWSRTSKTWTVSDGPLT